MGTIALYLAIVVVCLAASAFFSGSETALFRIRDHEVKEEVEGATGPAGVAIRELTSSASRLLVTVLLGNNVVNILGASVASALAVKLLGPELGIPVATGVMTALVLVLCEVIPKAVAAAHPRGVSRVIALPMYIFHQAVRPVHTLFDRVIEPVVKRITGGAGEHDPMSSEEVLRLARSVRDGQEDGTPLAIIGATSAAAEMTVNEIMVPRTEISAFDISTPPEELFEQSLEERYTRVPVFDGDIDQILGFIHFKDLVKFVREQGDDLGSILKPVLRVPERKPILSLLTDMQRAFCHIAVVKDEFGVTQGLVTQEDILEEIVGEIRDEFDSEELLTIRKRQDGSYDALGRISVRDLNRESGWHIRAERGDTLGGLIFNTLERAPRVGERVSIPGYDLICTDVSGSRIARVRVIARVEEDRLNGK